MNQELEKKLRNAKTLQEVEELLKDEQHLDPKKVFEEISKHRQGEASKLDLEELDAVNGGADRDWKTDGCAATCDGQSWCWSNDNCIVFDVTYSNFWRTCPDGHEHVFNDIKVCTRCGFSAPYNPDC